jgi:hypothetical protein
MRASKLEWSAAARLQTLGNHFDLNLFFLGDLGALGGSSLSVLTAMST